jgi:hypothetical protein
MGLLERPFSTPVIREKRGEIFAGIICVPPHDNFSMSD